MNTNTESTPMTETKPAAESEALRDCTSDELMLALLIAEVGSDRFEALRDKLFLHLNDDAKQEIIYFTESPLLALVEQLGDKAGAEGGLGEAFVETIGQHDLSEIGNAGRDPEVLGTTEVLLLALIEGIKVGEVDRALKLLDEHVSLAAGREARSIINGMLAEIRNNEPRGVTAEGVGRYITSRLPVDLRGPAKRERSQGASLLQALLGVLGGRAPEPPVVVGGGVSSLDDLLSTLERGGISMTGMQVFSVDELLGGQARPMNPIEAQLGRFGGLGALGEMLKSASTNASPDADMRQITVGDAYRALNVPFGLPSQVVDILRMNRPASDRINMDRIRSTPIGLFGLADKVNIEAAFDGLASEYRNAGGDGGGVGIAKELFKAIYRHLLASFGSIEEAEAKTVEWLVAQGEVKADTNSPESRFQSPTPGCDCSACGMVRRMGARAIRFDKSTGAPVKVAAPVTF